MPERGRYRRAALTGALAAVLVTTGVIAVRNASGDGRSVRAATSSSQDAREAQPTPASSTDAQGVPVDPARAMAPLLEQRGQAVSTRDRQAWLDTIAPSAKKFRTAQASVFTRLTALKPVSWSYRFIAATPLPVQQTSRTPGSEAPASTPGGWVAEVELTYRLTTGGPEVTRHQYLQMAPSGSGQWRIAGDAAGPTQKDLWDINPITILREDRCLVIASMSWRSLSQRVASACDRAAQRVDGVWGKEWPRTTVLVVPNSQQQLATLLARTDKGGAGLDNTAAVTIGPASAAAEQVLVNPAVFKTFPALGVRVVLTHELTHVATRAAGAVDAPTWLSEGFADWVGFSDAGLAPHEIAGDALDQVAKGKVPQTFPAGADFNAAGKDANAAYGYAWALVRTVAARGGTSTATEFYRQVATPANGDTEDERLTAAIGDVLKLTTQQQLIDAWQRELRSLAS